MLEIPEACIMASQLKNTVCGKKILTVNMNSSPHKFAFYVEDPANYSGLLVGKEFDTSDYYGGMVELKAHSYRLVFSDGVNLRFHIKGSPRPPKHQMLIEFSDDTALSASVQMYGGLWCFKEGTFDNEYRKLAMKKPSPLSLEFDVNYFRSLVDANDVQKLSLKAFLATEQRIPGLGNGVFQDIAWRAKLHPKRAVKSLSQDEKDILFYEIKHLLAWIVFQGGRDTDKDLFGKAGGYSTQMSKLHIDEGCAFCGDSIKKEPYMGGTIYYCPTCQK